MTFVKAQQALIDSGHRLGARGWLRATSGNLSVKIDNDPLTLAITCSGTDKQQLDASQIIGVSSSHVIWGEGRPSAETGIHQAIYKRTSATAVLHVHTVYNNLVSQWADSQWLRLRGNEMLKALGLWQEDAVLALPVLPNHADLNRLADEVYRVLDPAIPGILIRGHGIYAFGVTLEQATTHLEAFEYLFEWFYYQQLAHLTVPRRAAWEIHH
ncbi:MAG: methylthioribulose 1-phosphate dehydratase [Sulfobacillus sp.]